MREIPRVSAHSTHHTGDLSPFEVGTSSARDRGELLISHLESLALDPSLIPAERIMGQSSSLQLYSLGMVRLSIVDLSNKIKAQFPDQPFIAADIGGMTGTAARELEQSGCDRCFVIDPVIVARNLSAGLPDNRFIQRAAENLEGIPNDCFQFVVSFNALSYSQDLRGSIQEICRVLRPGGEALLDIKGWTKPSNLSALESLRLTPDIEISLVYSNPHTKRIAQSTLTATLAAIARMSEEDFGLFRLFSGSTFLISKKFSEAESTPKNAEKNN